MQGDCLATLEPTSARQQRGRVVAVIGGCMEFRGSRETDGVWRYVCVGVLLRRLSLRTCRWSFREEMARA